MLKFIHEVSGNMVKDMNKNTGPIKQKTRQEKIDILYKIIMLFTIGCFVGVVFETILCYFQRGYFESRKGLIYGPFNVIYGFGVVFIALILERHKKTSSIIIVGSILGGIIEYICSWCQETLFGTTSWDYSNYFLNFDGRTSIYHMIWWGILSFLFMKLIYSPIKKLIYKVKEEKRLLISIILIIFFTIDMLISGYANIRQSERIEGVEAKTVLQKFFDKYYPDEYINKIYPHRRDAKTKLKISKIKVK